MKTEIISKVGLSFVASILMLSGFAFAAGIQDVISTLKDIGVFQFYLPFLISFAVLYALLLKAKIFGEQKGLVTIIALAASGFIMVYTPVGIAFSQFLANFVGNAMVVILTLVVVIIFANMLKEKEGLGLDVTSVMKGGWLWVGLLLLLLLAFGVFVASGGTSIFPGLKISTKELFGPIGGLSSTTLAILVLVIGTGLIVFMFSKGEKPAPKTGG